MLPVPQDSRFWGLGHLYRNKLLYAQATVIVCAMLTHEKCHRIKCIYLGIPQWRFQSYSTTESTWGRDVDHKLQGANASLWKFPHITLLLPFLIFFTSISIPENLNPNFQQTIPSSRVKPQKHKYHKIPEGSIKVSNTEKFTISHNSKNRE